MTASRLEITTVDGIPSREIKIGSITCRLTPEGFRIIDGGKNNLGEKLIQERLYHDITDPKKFYRELRKDLQRTTGYQIIGISKEKKKSAMNVFYSFFL